MSPRQQPRVAILGAGPIGVEAALYAAQLGLPVTVYEQGRVGEHLHQWGHVRLFSPLGMNTTPLGLSVIRGLGLEASLPSPATCTTGHEYLSLYLDPLATSPLLRDVIQTTTRVLHIGRRGILKEELAGDARRRQHPFLLLIRGPEGEKVAEADVVLDCTGTYGQPRHLGDGGIPAPGEMSAAPHISYGLEDILGKRADHFADRNVLVIGSGYSAATSVCHLAQLAEKHTGLWTIWAARSGRSQPIQRLLNDPFRERDQLAVRANLLATRAEGNVEHHPQSTITEIISQGADKGFLVSAQVGTKSVVWEVDRVIANVGYIPDISIWRELQVQQSHVSEGPVELAEALERGGDGSSLLRGGTTVRSTEPGFHILGSKSYGRSLGFLLQVGFQQVREVFALIMGKPDLDLHGKG